MANLGKRVGLQIQMDAEILGFLQANGLGKQMGWIQRGVNIRDIPQCQWGG